MPINNAVNNLKVTDLKSSPYLRENELEGRYKLSAQWFRQARKEKQGPPYIQVGTNVIYSIKHTDDWFNSLLIKPKAKASLSIKPKGTAKPKAKAKPKPKRKAKAKSKKTVRIGYK